LTHEACLVVVKLIACQRCFAGVFSVFISMNYEYANCKMFFSNMAAACVPRVTNTRIYSTFVIYRSVLSLGFGFRIRIKAWIRLECNVKGEDLQLGPVFGL
jgi:hypothetical protein